MQNNNTPKIVMFNYYFTGATWSENILVLVVYIVGVFEIWKPWDAISSIFARIYPENFVVIEIWFQSILQTEHRQKSELK